MPGGRVRVGKNEFDSVSTAAVAAMKQATGVERTANGWDFWQVPTAEGKRVALATFRSGAQDGGRATGSARRHPSDAYPDPEAVSERLPCRGGTPKLNEPAVFVRHFARPSVPVFLSTPVDSEQQKIVNFVAGEYLKATDSISGKKIRSRLGPVVGNRVDSLVPRLLTRVSQEPTDSYRPTLRGLLHSWDASRFSRSLEMVLRVLHQKFKDNEDFQVYTWDDIRAKFADDPNVDYLACLAVIHAAGLFSAGTHNKDTFSYSVPSDIETLAHCQGDVSAFLSRLYEREQKDEVEGSATASGPAQRDVAPAPGRTRATSKAWSVFLVHGHDEEAVQSTAVYLKSLGLECVVLHEQPNKGRTIIEKFEDHAGEAEFAVVLMTPDDVGRPRNSDDGVLRLRARQNVVLELGFFLARLGRGKVCALMKGDIEVPSDYSGVVYVKLDAPGVWRGALRREIEAAGLKCDAGGK